MRKEVYVECWFLIPIRSDTDVGDGKLHSSTTWEWLNEQLFTLFEACTMAPGVYSGFYRDPDTGARVDDESRKFIIAIRRSKLRQLRKLLRQACRVFQQKCIYLSIAGEVELIWDSAD